MRMQNICMYVGDWYISVYKECYFLVSSLVSSYVLHFCNIIVSLCSPFKVPLELLPVRRF